MFLYYDESGDVSWPPEKTKIMVGTLLRFTRRETGKKIKEIVESIREDFEGYLYKIGKLKENDGIEYLKGSFIETKKSREEQKGKKRKDKVEVLGLGHYPERCLEFFKKLKDKGGDFEFYVIYWIKNPKQIIPPKEEARLKLFPDHEPRRRKETYQAEMRIYSMLLGDLLSSIRPSPQISSPEKTYKVPKGKRRGKIKQQKIINRITTFVVHQYKNKKIARQAFNSMIIMTLKVKGKLIKSWLQIWHNPLEEVECLQVVDILSNFFYQSWKLGIKVSDKKEITFKPVTKVIEEFLEKSPWTREKWCEAFEEIKPKIKEWIPITWLRRPTKKFKK